MTNHTIKDMLIFILLLAASTTFAEASNCTPITALPAKITVSGVYCFTGDLSRNNKSGNAINIKANSVTIDLQGWTLSGLGAGKATKAIGIYANKRKNITIRNGTIGGFFKGIHLRDTDLLDESQGHVVEDIRAHRNTYVGLHIMGVGNIVRRNQVVNTGGTTSIFDKTASGIWFEGVGGRLLDNDVSQVTAGSNFADGHAIRLSFAHNTVVEGNRIDSIAGAGSGEGIGVRIENSDDVPAVDNRISSADTGIDYGTTAIVQVSNKGNDYSAIHIIGSAIDDVTAALVDGNLCDSGDISGAWVGSVVLCERGAISYADKMNNVADSGGLAAVIYNNAPGNFSASCSGSCSSGAGIPGVSVSQAAGQFLQTNGLGLATRVLVDDGAGTDSTGKYRDNLTNNVAAGFIGGTDAGNND